MMECFGTVVSVSLQHGVPLRVLCDKLSHTRFEPSGWTGNEELGYAKSIMDYLFSLDGIALPVGQATTAVRCDGGWWRKHWQRVKPGACQPLTIPSQRL